MSGWRNFCITELADFCNAQRIPLSAMERAHKKGNFPYYGASGIVDYIDNYIFDGSYILISEDGENLKSRKTPIAFEATGKFWVNNHAHVLKAKKPHLTTLIIQYFSQLDLFPYLTGAAQPKLNKASLNLIPLYLPIDESEQKAIASILSSLKDKIDLLHRQNKTLESMAETMFRQWFIEEAQEKWTPGTLKDEFDFVMGQSPSGSSFNEDGIGMPMYQGNADFGFRFPSNRVFTTEPTRFAEPLDTLISVRAPVGAQNMALEKCCIGRGLSAFRFKINHEFYTYTYFKLRQLMDEIKRFNDEGTVFGSISKSDFEKIEITIPPYDKISSFEDIAKPINNKVIKNCHQIAKLENIRDTLLPKLMSGEVRVKYAEEEIAAMQE
ncbi:restriction endonuclease subunit S [Klebsiella pneumoniae]|uniref:restriction endonuclease subunit S n=2 Tax=Enterobacteriaceae TaxID=543 RepID=UPI0023AF4162|nr:restriction endonuclease subunit S [Citrobacter freundii]HBT2189818.1 restriction endonuclease subunit S [Klebsiella pneumoniae]HDT5424112.1 restriction endonuclease subunit S [Enterobacter hormaechei subsp. steigerwaltii]HED4123677.1 restriction endonuclease subunit S [Klebsiella variicola subsp. variicola]HBX7937903.1 restriction endonuclease subunit S [Klebsiella pneumoniae]HEO9570974.1 restriction endonuclease subunit S [Enterobacter hormaechei subsp. steigerwaltii]